MSKLWGLAVLWTLNLALRHKEDSWSLSQGWSKNWAHDQTNTELTGIRWSEQSLTNIKWLHHNVQTVKEIVLVLKRRAESKRGAVGKEGRVLIESECVCVGCWSEMGRGPSWLLLQRLCPSVLAHLQPVKPCSHHSGRGGTSPQLRALTTKPVAKRRNGTHWRIQTKNTR